MVVITCGDALKHAHTRQTRTRVFAELGRDSAIYLPVTVRALGAPTGRSMHHPTGLRGTEEAPIPVLNSEAVAELLKDGVSTE